MRAHKRKIARPIDPKRPLHLVLRSSRARGAWSFLHPKNARRVRGEVDRSARKYGIRIYRYANVGNHLHLLVVTRTRKAFRGFLREMAGAISTGITGSRKSHPLGGKFWDFLPYTRVVNWGKDFTNIELYFIKNLFEAAGLLTRKAKEAGARVISIRGWTRPG